jgi:hypothetical protein
MNPKEKAQELYDKFYAVKNPNGLYAMSSDMAKECALIAVNEIALADVFHTNEFWWNIKQELKSIHINDIRVG